MELKLNSLTRTQATGELSSFRSRREAGHKTGEGDQDPGFGARGEGSRLQGCKGKGVRICFLYSFGLAI